MGDRWKGVDASTGDDSKVTQLPPPVKEPPKPNPATLEKTHNPPRRVYFPRRIKQEQVSTNKVEWWSR